MFAFAFHGALPVISTQGVSSRCARVPARMALGKQPQKSSVVLESARRILNSEDALSDMNEVMQSLEQRRDELIEKIEAISTLMDELRELQKPKETFVNTAVDSVAQVFSVPKDDYPTTGIPSGYTMDLPKKK